MNTSSNKNESGFIREDSSAESIRFGYNVQRYYYLGKKPKSLIKAIKMDSPDIAIVRIPTDQAFLIKKFHHFCDDVILADCLTGYKRDNIKLGKANPIRNKNFSLEEATDSDISLLDELTEKIFYDYRNHYSSNPLFNQHKLTDAFKEWTRSYVSSDSQKNCLIAYLDNDVCGYATVRIDENESEGILYGVLPEFRGKGVYRDIIRSSLDYFIQMGSPKTIVSTQIDNKAVQRVWSTEGFHLNKTLYTIHLNMMGSIKKEDRNAIAIDDLVITDSLIKQFAEFSGDLNPIHMDKQSAISAGFPDRIIHGAAVIGKISKILGNKYPGQGTIILDTKIHFNAPLVIGKSYSISIYEFSPLKNNRPHELDVIVKEKNTSIILLSGRINIIYNPLQNKSMVDKVT